MDVDLQPEKANPPPQTEMDNHPSEIEIPSSKEKPSSETDIPPREIEKSVDNRLQDWTKNEIFDLLQTIKVFGSQNLDQIAENIPTKTAQQIQEAIAYYRERAAQNTQKREPHKKRNWSTTKQNPPAVPLIGWAKFLQDSLSFNDLHTETPTALRIIAEFDKIPPATHTDNIDFKNIYHYIANAMEGKAIPDNAPIATILNKCIVETALTSRAFMRMGALQNVVEWIDMSDKAISILPRPTENVELATLRHLASQRTYNPLGIPEHNLKPS